MHRKLQELKTKFPTKCNNFRLSDLPALAPNNNLKKLCGFWAQFETHLFPVKKGGCSLHQDKPSLALGTQSDPSSSFPSSALAISHSPASQGVEQDEVVFYFGGTDMSRVRNISTSQHYFYPRTWFIPRIEAEIYFPVCHWGRDLLLSPSTQGGLV